MGEKPPKSDHQTTNRSGQERSVAIGVGRTLRESVRILLRCPGGFLFVGCIGAIVLMLAAYIALWLTGAITSLIATASGIVVFFVLFSPGFAYLCAMAIHIRKGTGGCLPAGRDIWRIIPSAPVMGAIYGTILSLAFFGPLIIVRNASGLQGGGFFDGTWLMNAFIIFVVALPIIIGFTFFVVLPGLGLAFPAVADGTGVLKALGLSLHRGMCNLGPALVLEIVAGTALVLFFIIHAQLSGIITAWGAAHDLAFWAGSGIKLLALLEITIYTSWLAALLGSAYVQATD